MCLIHSISCIHETNLISCLHSTLAGSTIMLLTVPWIAAMWLGRVDIVKGKGIDGQCSKLKCSSFVTQVWAHVRTHI